MKLYFLVDLTLEKLKASNIDANQSVHVSVDIVCSHSNIMFPISTKSLVKNIIKLNIIKFNSEYIFLQCICN